MPLINCPDCGHQISDAAPDCIKCGRPMKKPEPSIAAKSNLRGFLPTSVGGYLMLGLALSLFLIGVSACLEMVLGSRGSAQRRSRSVTQTSIIPPRATPPTMNTINPSQRNSNQTETGFNPPTTSPSHAPAVAGYIDVLMLRANPGILGYENHFRVRNSSDHVIGLLGVGINYYDQAGNYVTKGNLQVSDLNPGAEETIIDTMHDQKTPPFKYTVTIDYLSINHESMKSKYAIRVQ